MKNTWWSKGLRIRFKHNENPINPFRFSSFYHFEAIYSTSMQNSMKSEKNPQIAIPRREEFSSEFFKFTSFRIFSYIFLSSMCTCNVCKDSGDLSGWENILHICEIRCEHFVFLQIWKAAVDTLSERKSERARAGKTSAYKNKRRKIKTQTKIKINNRK